MNDSRICFICKIRKSIKHITPYTRTGTHYPICKDCAISNEAIRLQLVQLLNRHCNLAHWDRYDPWPEGIAHHRDRDGSWVCIGFIPIDDAIQQLKTMRESYLYMAQEIEEGLAVLAR